MKPILFNTEMVRAILDGRKTVTRRVVKGYALEHLELDTDGSIIGVYDQFEGHVRPVMDYSPYRPCDILYVRETWCKTDCFGLQNGYVYKATDNSILEHTGFAPKWHPSIHMPRKAARIFLRVTDVRVERLQDMPPEQIAFDGFRRQRNFIAMWDSTIKKADRALYGWAANPWVWVIEFERVDKSIKR